MRVKDMTLKERFDAKGFGVVKYARAHNLSQPRLSEVLAEKIATGVNPSRTGAVRKVFRQLKADGIWVGALPWEVKK